MILVAFVLTLKILSTLNGMAFKQSNKIIYFEEWRVRMTVQRDKTYLVSYYFWLILKISSIKKKYLFVKFEKSNLDFLRLKEI
jgi:hypothetical protein